MRKKKMHLEEEEEEEMEKALNSQEWETLIEDFQSGREEKWLSQQYSPLSLLDLSLSSLLRKDISNLKLSLIIFLEEYSSILIPSEADIEPCLGKLLETLRSFIQAPIDGISITYSLKEQIFISATSIFISLDGLKHAIRHLQSLTELLLTVVNRPNHGVDRQTRGVACECLRELERTYPCLLADVSGHLWTLCQNERTHCLQSYVLLLTSVVDNVVTFKTNASIIATSVPLVPFNVPAFVLGDFSNTGLSFNLKELRRVMAFLLERPQIFTPCALMEFMSMIVRVANALDLQASLLKVQFSGLLYSYDPMLCHVVLMLYSHFSDSFDGQEGEIVRRLVLISKEVQQHLVFRLLALHWLFGFVGVGSLKGNVVKKSSVVSMVSSFYPTVFDPLALKSMKLDLLAYCAVCLATSNLDNKPKGVSGEGVDSGVVAVNLFKDGLVSVSTFKWLPPWSTETAVAFRAFHKFLIGAIPHSMSDDSTVGIIMDSNIFSCIQRMLVDLALEFRRLVPVIVAFIDRQLGCQSHCWLGERLLQTLDEHLLPKLITDQQLPSYFLIFDRIAKNDTIPPRGLLELLTQFVIAIVKKHGPDTGLKSWSQGNKVLGICRTMLTHHHTSRVFLVLSRLLAFTCLYFPDLEVRDNARIYLRMLVCIPGRKLRHILNHEEQLPGKSPSSHTNSFHDTQPSQDFKKSRNLSTYIHLERVIELLVKQSWTLSISTLDIKSSKNDYFEGINDSEACVLVETDVDESSDIHVSESDRIDSSQEPLRVMDSKASEILGILRRHFICIPDFRYMPGFKIKILCTLRFESEPFNHIWGVKSTANNLDGCDHLPAIYATVLTFSSTSPYGSIPSRPIPFLLGDALRDANASGQIGNLDVIPLGAVSERQDSFRARVVIELEPREPMPGLVDVAIEANAENGQIIRGELQSITVGIEDMFLKVSVPSDVLDDALAGYYSDLFSALWDACNSSSNTGRETFPLKGGKGVAAISGTRSVKLLEVSAGSLIRAIEQHLAPFVVTVSGGPLISVVKDSGIIKDIIWKDEIDVSVDVNSWLTDFDIGPLQLKYMDDENGRESHVGFKKRNMGCFFILIFLPPRFHLLFQMEVCDISTLVRIRTDHWPCLAYIDDYLEALFLT
ncbi:hypothetical protein IFM89_007705 [Coptis chinensis]|uniref:AP-5 complex subunit beta-1 n=1 Tax=Coptis chinensis TaxID=261450 RepID=A0A835MBY5_9MAGN|nr:hypothetical protein IFM89_007705 [Coptis chinensis]